MITARQMAKLEYAINHTEGWKVTGQFEFEGVTTIEVAFSVTPTQQITAYVSGIQDWYAAKRASRLFLAHQTEHKD